MDPLSLTASIVAIIGVGGQAAKAIKKLASVRGAPYSIFALNNELSDLQLVVAAVEEILKAQQAASSTSISGNQAYDASVNASVTSSLDQVNRKALELQSMYQRLTQPASGSTSSTPKLNKATWLLEQNNLKRLKEDLRAARLKLAATLGVLNT